MTHYSFVNKPTSLVWRSFSTNKVVISSTSWTKRLFCRTERQAAAPSLLENSSLPQTVLLLPKTQRESSVCNGCFASSHEHHLEVMSHPSRGQNLSAILKRCLHTNQLVAFQPSCFCSTCCFFNLFFCHIYLKYIPFPTSFHRHSQEWWTKQNVFLLYRCHSNFSG